MPKGVTFNVQGNLVTVKGPKGTVSNHLPAGVKLGEKDGVLTVTRDEESKRAIHGLVRALVNNAVEGVTKGWTKNLEIVGIGYRAEMKGKGIVVFTLGYSHPIEYPLPAGIEVTVDPKQTALTHHRHRPAEGRTGCGGNARAASTGSVQEQGCALCGREAEEEGRQDRREIRD